MKKIRFRWIGDSLLVGKLPVGEVRRSALKFFPYSYSALCILDGAGLEFAATRSDAQRRTRERVEDAIVAMGLA